MLFNMIIIIKYGQAAHNAKHMIEWGQYPFNNKEMLKQGNKG
jgi:hypothetical protein